MKNILEKLEAIARKFADKTVFAENGNDAKEISYSDFVLKCKKTASAISTLKFTGGGVKNNPIAVFDNRNINTLIGMFGVVYSGNYYIVLDANSPVERLQKIVDIIKPVAFVCEEGNMEKLNALSVGGAKALDIEKAKHAEADEKFLAQQRANMISTDPLYALFTSGSTGLPKGTILSHQNVLSYIEWFVSTFDINEKTIFANQTPFYFSMSVSDIFGTLVTGATFNIVPKSYFSFPIQLVRLLNEKQINTIYWVPSAISIVANIKLFDYEKPQFLKKVLFAGEVMPNKQLNYWRKNLPNAIYANLFGPTETTDICTYYIVNREFADDEGLPIGKHCDNCDTFVVGDDGKEVTEQGKVGELFARGPFVAYGYFDNPEKTAAAFVQNPLQSHYPEIVYKTGDLVKINEFGEYVYMGRKDFQIKHMGYRIELGEIETAASSLDKINSNVCIYDADKDLIVMVYEGKLKEDELSNIIKEKVPYYMVPNVVIKVKQMPYNANGKIDRSYLKTNYKELIKKEN